MDLVCTVLCKLSHVQSEDSTIGKCGLERAMKSRKVLRTKLESVWRSGTCLTQSESFPSPRPTRPSYGRPFCRTESPTSFGSRLLLYLADSAVPAEKKTIYIGFDLHLVVGKYFLGKDFVNTITGKYLPAVLPVVLATKLSWKSLRVKELCDICLQERVGRTF